MFKQLLKSKISRTPEEQHNVDIETQKLNLYYSPSCPFCIIVTHAIKKLSINIELVDINRNQEARNELIKKGGKSMVPCLKIMKPEKDQWLYESADIIAYLESRFS